MAVNCLSFDGNDDVNFGNNAAHQLTVLSLEIWIKHSAASAVELIISKFQNTTTDGYEMQMSATGLVTFNCADASGNDSVNSASEFDDGIWHHAATTFSTSTKVLEIYKDGVDDGGATNTFGIVDSGQALLLGKRVDISTNQNTGKMSDFRLWNDIRTAGEISANYQSRLIGNEAGLAGYWKIDEGTGTNLDDLTSNNFDGTITGATWATDGPEFGSASVSPSISLSSSLSPSASASASLSQSASAS